MSARLLPVLYRNLGVSERRKGIDIEAWDVTQFEFEGGSVPSLAPLLANLPNPIVLLSHRQLSERRRCYLWPCTRLVIGTRLLPSLTNSAVLGEDGIRERTGQTTSALDSIFHQSLLLSSSGFTSAHCSEGSFRSSRRPDERRFGKSYARRLGSQGHSKWVEPCPSQVPRMIR